MNNNVIHVIGATVAANTGGGAVRARHALVHGPPGCGKRALLGLLRARVVAGGVLVAGGAEGMGPSNLSVGEAYAWPLVEPAHVLAACGSELAAGVNAFSEQGAQPSSTLNRTLTSLPPPNPNPDKNSTSTAGNALELLGAAAVDLLEVGRAQTLGARYDCYLRARLPWHPAW
ncbi:hypothetical protein T492DRAFT_847769 [Pavlovales sp. CCMP2436]|nr:hypothetical protein T492DRAFT_847769 [Pavlovales sp. CCMP2436]